MKACNRHLKEWDSPYRSLMNTYMGINRLHRMVLERQLNRTGVFRSQHQLLMYICNNPYASQKEIARLHHVSPATVAVSLKKLEHGGYIKRVVDQNDNRFNQICITEKGKGVVDGSIRYFQTMEAQLFEGFATEELEKLQGYLSRMYENLNRLLPESEREEQE